MEPVTRAQVLKFGSDKHLGGLDSPHRGWVPPPSELLSSQVKAALLCLAGHLVFSQIC